MSAELPQNAGHGADGDFWREGLDRTFFSKMYGRSAVIGAAAAMLAIFLEQRGVALGLIGGVGLGLFSTWTLELTARLLFNGGSHAGTKLALGAAVKLPAMLGSLALIAWAGQAGHLNVFAVIGGILIIHTTMVISVIATAIAAQDRLRERYR